MRNTRTPTQTVQTRITSKGRDLAPHKFVPGWEGNGSVMMPEASQQATSAPPSWSELRQHSDLLLDRYDATMAEVAAGTCSPDLARRVSLLTAAFREHHGQLNDITWHEAVADEIETRAFQAGRDAERAAGSSRRRVPAPRHAARNLRPVYGIAIAATGALAALRAIAKHAARHHAVTAFKAAWAAHPVPVILGGTAATGATAALLTAAAVTLVPPVTHPGIYADPSVPAPAASIWAAVPVTASSPGAPVVSHGKTDARQARQLGVIPLAPWSPAPSPSPSASPSLTPAPGMLSADTAIADLSSGAPVTVTLTATGAPVDWAAWCDPSIDVVLSAAEGIASPGQPSLLTLSVPADEGGDTRATCHIWPGAIVVRVVLPGPVPSPSPSPTDSGPTDTPTPDPSSS